MGIIRRLKGTSENNNNNNRLPRTEVVVRNNAKSKQQQQPRESRGNRSSGYHRRALDKEESIVRAAPRDRSKKQRMHVDLLFHIGNRYVKESLDHEPPKALRPQERNLSKPTRMATKHRWKEEEKKEEDTVLNEHSIASFSFVDLLSGLSLCGCNKLEHEDTSERPAALEEEKEMDPTERVSPPPIIQKIPEIPHQISFQERTETSWTDNHVLLTEVFDDEVASLDNSLISRMSRRMHWVRRPAGTNLVPKMKVYVDMPKRVSNIRSDDLSVLTDPHHR